MALSRPKDLVRRREGIVVWFVTFVLYACISWYNVFRLHIAWNDAASRSWAALSVFTGYEAPKLANVGFIWPPLPTMLEIPFMVINKFTFYGFGGDLLTAFMSGLVVVYLNALFARFGLSRGLRWVILALYIVNPDVVMFGTSGMSEPIMLVILVGSMFHLLHWQHERRLTDLIILGFYASMSTMVRYEAWPFTLAILFAILIMAGGMNRKRWAQFESVTIIFLLPVVYVLAAFMFWKHEITGTFDLTGGVYSQGNYVGQNVMAAGSSLASSLAYGLVAVAELFPLYLPSIAIAFILYFRRPTRFLISMIGLATAFPVIETALIYFQYSFGWLRFFVYIVPGTVALLGYCLSRLHWDLPGLRHWLPHLTVAGCLVGLLVSNVATGVTLASNRPGIENETLEMKAWLTGAPENSLYLEESVAQYINAHVHSRSVLIDDFIGAKIILLSDKPQLFIDTRDTDFQRDLIDPVGHVSYILVPVPEFVNQLDAINRQYPNLYNQGAPFVTLVREFTGLPTGMWTAHVTLGNPLRHQRLIDIRWTFAGDYRLRWRLYRLDEPIQPSEAMSSPLTSERSIH